MVSDPVWDIGPEENAEPKLQLEHIGEYEVFCADTGL